MDFLTDTNNLLILVVAFISGMMLLFPSLSAKGGNQINPNAAVQMMNQRQAILIDIRSADSYKAHHIPQTRHIPSAEIVDKTAKIDKDKPIILVCNTGRSAAAPAAALRKNGFTNVSVLEGGITAWAQAGLPTKSS